MKHHAVASPEREFTKVVRVLTRIPTVSQPIGKKGFGSSGLYVGGKLFAFLSYKKQLILKLPSERVDELVTRGEGTRFDPRRDGKGMKEWFVLKPSSRMRWLPLAKEALKFLALSKARKD
jgi:hypothetical protein